MQEKILAALSSDDHHDHYETYKITIGGAGIAVGPDTACHDVFLSTNATDLQVTIVDHPEDVKDGDTDGFHIPATITTGGLLLNVQNPRRLRFYATAGKFVYLLVRIHP